MRTPAFALTATVDGRDLARYEATLAKLEGKPLYERVDKALLTAGQKIVVPAAKREAPKEQRATYQRTGHKVGALRASIRARKIKRRFGELAAAIVYPASPVAHLVIQGTHAHSLETRKSGKSLFAAFGIDEVRATSGLQHPGSSPNPFMDRAMEKTDDAVAELIARDVFGAL